MLVVYLAIVALGSLGLYKKNPSVQFFKAANLQKQLVVKLQYQHNLTSLFIHVTVDYRKIKEL